jgi:hypothetical protein
MATSDNRRDLPPKDKRLLELTSQVDWLPPDPSDLITPYLEKRVPDEEGDMEQRRRKAQEVMEGYAKIIETCRELRAMIEERCNDVRLPLDPVQDKGIIDAARRLFKRDVTEITFEMYKQAVHAAGDISNANLPRPGGGS